MVANRKRNLKQKKQINLSIATHSVTSQKESGRNPHSKHPNEENQVMDLNLLCGHFVSIIDSLIFLKIPIVLLVHNRNLGMCIGRRLTELRIPTHCRNPLEFGDSILSNHKILKKSTPDRKYDRCTQIMRDAATEWFQACPSPSHSADTVVEHFLRFHPPKVVQARIY